MKPDKMLYNNYSDMESLIKKIDECAHNPENSSTTKIGEHISCAYSMSIIWAFDQIKNKYTLCRGKNWIKRFCGILWITSKIKNKMLLLLTKK